MSSSYPNVFVDHARNVPATMEPILSVSLLLFQVHCLLEIGVLDYFFSAVAILASRVSNLG